MNRRVLLAALVLFAAGGAADTAPPAPASHTVVIEGMQFTPATLNVRAGDSVTWVNKDIVDHTATTPASARNAFDSRLIPAGKSWKRTFSEAGSYDYLCTYHPTMTGMIKVAATRPAPRRRSS